MRKEFEKGNTIRFECEYRDFDGALVTPVSSGYQILDSKGAVEQDEDDQALTLKSEGVYYFTWTSSEVDDYIVEFTGTIGLLAGKARKIFKVTETLIK